MSTYIDVSWYGYWSWTMSAKKSDNMEKREKKVSLFHWKVSHPCCSSLPDFADWHEHLQTSLILQETAYLALCLQHDVKTGAVDILHDRKMTKNKSVPKLECVARFRQRCWALYDITKGQFPEMSSFVMAILQIRQRRQMPGSCYLPLWQSCECVAFKWSNEGCSWAATAACYHRVVRVQCKRAKAGLKWG